MNILKQLESSGWKIRIAPISRLVELKGDYQALVEQQAFTEDVAGMLAHIFRFSPPEGLDARSMLCVAVPSPIASAVFRVSGKRLEAEIPPTYTDYGTLTETPAERLPGPTQEKFDRLNMKAYYEAVPRNLKALLLKEGLL